MKNVVVDLAQMKQALHSVQSYVYKSKTPYVVKQSDLYQKVNTVVNTVKVIGETPTGERTPETPSTVKTTGEPEKPAQPKLSATGDQGSVASLMGILVSMIGAMMLIFTRSKFS